MAVNKMLKVSGTLKLPSFTTDPTGGQNGSIYYNSATNRFRVYEDGVWLDVIAGAVPLIGQPLENGKIIIGDSANLSSAVTPSGDATISNTGVITIGAGKITNSQLAQMPANTIKGNNEGVTANPKDLTAAEATAVLNAFSGDSGSGGLKGLVPAPSAGDAAAGKYLSADGGFSVPELVNDTSPQLSANLDANSKKITNLANGTSASDAVNKDQLDDAVSTLQSQILDHIEDTSDAHDASAISVSSIPNLSATNVQDAIAELQSDINSISGDYVNVSGDTMTGNLSMGNGVTNNKITNLANGTNPSDAVNKSQLDSAVGAVNVSIDQVRFVSKNGNDSTGTGSLNKPYASLTAAFNSITDASPTKRYVVRVAAGAYSEAAIALPANVFVVGESKESVRITGPVSMGAWTQNNSGSDDRSGFSMVSLLSAVNLNWDTAKSRAGKIYMNEVVFGSTVNLYGYDNAIAQAQFDSSVIFGALTISGINVGVFSNNTCLANVTMNQHPNGGMATILNASGGQCNGTVTLNATTNDFNRRCSLFAKNFYMEYVTVNGPSAYADMNEGSLPRSRDRISATNGGNVVYITTKAPHVTNTVNIGEPGYQYLYNFAYVHGSTDTDLYVVSMGSAYSAANTGRSIFIESDTYGLDPNVNGGDINLTTAATSGTGVRGKIKLDAREIDASNSKITNLANGTNASDAVNKGQLDGAVSAEQTRAIAAEALKVNKAGDTMTGNLLMGDGVTNNRIKNLANPVDGGDAVNFNTLDLEIDSAVSAEQSRAIAAEATKVNKAGDTMTGNLNMGDGVTNNRITNLADPVAGTDAVNLNSLNTAINNLSPLYVDVSGDTMTGDLNMGNNDIQNASSLEVKDGSGNQKFLADDSQLKVSVSGNISLAGAKIDAQAELDMNSHVISDLADPSNPQDAATKAYVDNAIAGLSWKEAVHAASASGENVNIASPGTLTLDGHPLNSGERILLKDQTTQSENGIYVYNGSGSPLTRATDGDTWNELFGAVVYVQNGDSNSGSKWVNSSPQSGTLGSSPITFVLFSAATALEGSGTAGHNAYWSSASILTSEAHVAPQRGGLGTDASSFNGVVKAVTGAFSASKIVDGDVDPSAAIAYSKLNLTGGIVDSDISNSAAIDRAKLEPGTGYNWVVNNSSGVMSESSVAPNKAVATDANGLPVASNTTATELGYLSGVTSSVQTQLNSKLQNVVEDLSPQLGGDLDLNGHVISSPLKVGSGAQFIEESYIHNATLLASQTNAVLSALTFAHATYMAMDISYTLKDSGTNAVRVGQLRVVSNGTDIGISEDFADSSDVGVSWDAQINGSNVEILYSSTVNNKVLRASVKKFLA